MPTVLYCHRNFVLNFFVNQNPLRQGCAATAAPSHSGHLPLQILIFFKQIVFYNRTKHGPQNVHKKVDHLASLVAAQFDFF